MHTGPCKVPTVQTSSPFTYVISPTYLSSLWYCRGKLHDKRLVWQYAYLTCDISVVLPVKMSDTINSVFSTNTVLLTKYCLCYDPIHLYTYLFISTCNDLKYIVKFDKVIFKNYKKGDELAKEFHNRKEHNY